MTEEVITNSTPETEVSGNPSLPQSTFATSDSYIIGGSPLLRDARTTMGMVSEEVATQLIELETKRIKVFSGWIGVVFGYGRSAASNTASIITILLIFILGIYSLCPGVRVKEIAIKDLWLCVTPILTLCIGSLFGSRSDKN